MNMNRRSFLYASGGLGLSPFAIPQGSTTTSTVPPDISRLLARHALSTTLDQLPAPVRKEASRTLLNWIGCTLGATQVTGFIGELLLASDAGATTTAWAKATLSANHLSGNTLALYWRIAGQA